MCIPQMGILLIEHLFHLLDMVLQTIQFKHKVSHLLLTHNQLLMLNLLQLLMLNLPHFPLLNLLQLPMLNLLPLPMLNLLPLPTLNLLPLPTLNLLFNKLQLEVNLELNMFLTKDQSLNMKNKKSFNTFLLKSAILTTILLNTKLNMFLKSSKRDTLNTSQLIGFKRELNTIQLKDRLSINQLL